MGILWAILLILQTKHFASLTPRVRLVGQRLEWGTHKYTKADGETNLLSDWGLPKPQSIPYSKPEVERKINMDKLNLEHDSPQEEQIQVTNSLIPPPTIDKEEKATMEEKTDAETRCPQDKEKYDLQQKIYMG